MLARKNVSRLRLGVAGACYRAGRACCLLHRRGCSCAAVWLQDLPDYNDASAYQLCARKPSVYANDGTTLLAEFYLENRDPDRALDEMGTYVTKGTVATEDERFYQHNGIDVLGIARAVVGERYAHRPAKVRQPLHSSLYEILCLADEAYGIYAEA